MGYILIYIRTYVYMALGTCKQHPITIWHAKVKICALNKEERVLYLRKKA